MQAPATAPSDVPSVGLNVKFTVQKIVPKENISSVQHDIFLETIFTL